MNRDLELEVFELCYCMVNQGFFDEAFAKALEELEKGMEAKE